MKVLIISERPPVKDDFYRGSEDGFTIQCYYVGREYDMADTLARTFIRFGWAKEIKQEHAA